MEVSDTIRHGSITGTVSATQYEGPIVPIHNAEILVYSGKQREGNKLVRTGRSRRDGSFEIHGLPEGEYCVSTRAFGLRLPTEKDKVATVTHGCPFHVCLELGLDLNITVCRHTEADTLEACTLPVVGTSVIVGLQSKAPKGAIASVRWNSTLEGSLTPVDPCGLEMAFTPGKAGLTLLSATAIENREAYEYETAAREALRDEAATSEAEAREPNIAAAGGRESGGGPAAEVRAFRQLAIADAPIRMIGGKVGVSLSRTAANRTADQALWSLIRNRTRAISFTPYNEFIHRVLCQERDQPADPKLRREIHELGNSVHGVGAYQLLKTATEVFLLLECGVCLKDLRFDMSRPFDPDEESARWGEPVTFQFVKEKLFEYLGGHAHQLPYITNVIRNAFPGLHEGRIFCDRVLTSRAKEPCLLELIWSYWHEEGMLVQTMNAISRRFQNVRMPGGDRDPLAHLETDPLRPVNNLLWGQIQDEQNHLTVVRRA
jgi:hypothetical protein